MLKKVKYFDLFGIKNEITYEGKTTYGTNIGLFFTLFFIICGFLGVIYFGDDLYFRENPETITSDLFDLNPEEHIFDLEKEPLVFDIKGFDGFPFKNESYVVPELTQIHFYRVYDTNSKEFKMKSKIYDLSEFLVSCNLSLFNKLSKENFEYYNNLELSKMYCVNPTLKNLTIGGAYDSKTFKYFRLSWKKCNFTNRKNCVNEEEMNKKFHAGYAAIYTIDYNIDNSKYMNFQITYTKNIYGSLSNSMLKGIDLLYRNNYIKTDNGIIFKNYFHSQIVSMDSFREMVHFGQNNEIFYFDVKMIQKKVEIHRKYLKFQQVLAQIGGLLNALYLIFVFITFPFSNLIYKIDLVNKIYSFFSQKLSVKEIHESLGRSIFNIKETDTINFKKSQMHASKIQINKMKKQENTSNLMLFNESKTNIVLSNEGNTNLIIPNEKAKSTNVLKDTENLKYEKYNLKLNFLDYFFYFFNCKIPKESLKKQKLMNEGINLISEKLDIEHVIHKLYEIDKLKILLLSQEQLKLFEMLPKPSIMINDDFNVLNSQFLLSKDIPTFQKKWKFMEINRKSAVVNQDKNEKRKICKTLNKIKNKNDKISKRFAKLFDYLIDF